MKFSPDVGWQTKRALELFGDYERISVKTWSQYHLMRMGHELPATSLQAEITSASIQGFRTAFEKYGALFTADGPVLGEFTRHN